MKDNHKTLMKISLALTIVGAGYTKSCIAYDTACALSSACIQLACWSKTPSQSFVPSASPGVNTSAEARSGGSQGVSVRGGVSVAVESAVASNPSQSPAQPIGEAKLKGGEIKLNRSDISLSNDGLGVTPYQQGGSSSSTDPVPATNLTLEGPTIISLAHLTPPSTSDTTSCYNADSTIQNRSDISLSNDGLGVTPYQQGGSSSSTDPAPATNLTVDGGTIIGLAHLTPPSTSDTTSCYNADSTIHITLRNLAGVEYGPYTVDRNATLSQLVNANDLHGQFVLPGALEKLGQSRAVGDILQAQDPTGESDVLTLQYIRYITWSLDFSLLNTKDLPEFAFSDLQLSSTLTPEGQAIIMDNRRKCREYVEEKLGLPNNPDRKIELLAFRTTGGRLNLLINGDNLWPLYLYNAPINEEHPVLYYGTTDPSNLDNLKTGNNIPQFLKTLLNQEGAGEGEADNKVCSAREPTADKPFGFFFFRCNTDRYKCIYIENEYVVITLT